MTNPTRTTTSQIAIAVAAAIGLLLASTSATVAQVVINEFVAKNDSVGGYQEPDGGYGDWIELYNRGTADVDLSGYGLSDTTEMPARWTFPQGSVIPGSGYLIVWADDDEGQTGIHTDFKLSGDGEQVVLSLNGTVLDEVTFGPQRDNIAEARRPNGTGAFVQQTPTPLSSNESVSTSEVSQVTFTVYPSPSDREIRVVLGEYSFGNYRIIDALGGISARGAATPAGDVLIIDVADLPVGNYMILFDEGRGIGRFLKK